MQKDKISIKIKYGTKSISDCIREAILFAGLEHTKEEEAWNRHISTCGFQKKTKEK